MRRATLAITALAALFTLSCGTGADDGCDPLADADFDGLDDCVEQGELGTDITVQDKAQQVELCHLLGHAFEFVDRVVVDQ